MSEKLCLQWNDFQENIKSAFEKLKEDADFKDVTLVCEDGQQLEAHKVILASSSPFFQKLLGRNKHHHHPLIYMRGLKFDTLLAVLDFLYRGEANVFQEDLDSFLSIAEELQLRGLMGKTNERAGEDPEGGGGECVAPKLFPNSNTRMDLNKTSSKIEAPRNKIAEGHTTVALPSYHSGDLDQLEQMVKSMMEKSENSYANGQRKADKCKVCGKEGMGSAIKDHIEANHIEGIVIPCNLCEKTFRSRNALRLHNRFHHITP